MNLIDIRCRKCRADIASFLPPLKWHSRETFKWQVKSSWKLEKIGKRIKEKKKKQNRNHWRAVDASQCRLICNKKIKKKRNTVALASSIYAYTMTKGNIEPYHTHTQEQSWINTIRAEIFGPPPPPPHLNVKSFGNCNARCASTVIIFRFLNSHALHTQSRLLTCRKTFFFF